MLGGVRGRRLVTASYSIVSFWEKAWRVKSASCFLWLLPIDGCGKARYDETRPKAPGELLWSSIFVTLVAKKYHESVTLPSGLRMVYDNH